MDNAPLSGSSAEPESLLSDETKSEQTQSTLLSIPRAPSPANRDPFPGQKSLYHGAFWLIYLAMAWIVFEVEGWLAASLRSDLSLLWWRLMIEGCMMLAAILPGFVMARIEDRPFGDFGLPEHRAFRRNFWVGTLWGIASLSVLMLVLRIVGAFEFGALSLHGARIFKFAAYYAALFLITGFFEEFLVRGYSQWALSRVMNFWPAAALLSIAFGCIHGANPGESKTGLVAAGLIGFFLCLALRRTGDLWWAVGFHMAWDWGESYL
jgi:membrane protease YdiL (CAAX protease family)